MKNNYKRLILCALLLMMAGCSHKDEDVSIKEKDQQKEVIEDPDYKKKLPLENGMFLVSFRVDYEEKLEPHLDAMSETKDYESFKKAYDHFLKDDPNFDEIHGTLQRAIGVVKSRIIVKEQEFRPWEKMMAKKLMQFLIRVKELDYRDSEVKEIKRRVCYSYLGVNNLDLDEARTDKFLGDAIKTFSEIE